MSFGGFLGMAEDHYPLPWRKLKYGVARPGFVIDLSKDKLDRAPKYERERLPDYDPAYGTQDRADRRFHAAALRHRNLHRRSPHLNYGRFSGRHQLRRSRRRNSGELC